MRDKYIIDTLKHTESRKQELQNMMFEAKLQDNKLDNISNLVGDILNNLTICFDYCANDIYDKFIFSKILAKKTRPKIYFPFYKKQLDGKRNPWNSLIIHKKVVHDSLFEIIEKSDSKELIGNTKIPYSIAKEVRSLVNNHKHNKVIEIDKNGRVELLSKSKIGNITIANDQLNQNGFKVEVFPDIEKTEVIAKSYRLIVNNREVADFCWDSQIATQQILDKIYRKFFGVKIIV